MRRVAPFALAALAGMPALAKEKPPVFVEAEPIRDKPTIVLDPGKAHVLIRARVGAVITLMRVPDAAEQQTYDRLRAEALIKEHAKYIRRFHTYELMKAMAAKRNGIAVPDKPVEPTEANFQFPSFGLMTAVTIGPFNRFAKGEKLSTYVEALTPGSYRIYGVITGAPHGPQLNACFCMGSVRFDAAAGEMVDLGVVAMTDVPKVEGDSSLPVDLTGQALFTPALASALLDPRLSAARVVPARYRPIGKLPNYFSRTVARIPAMPGVMRYDRDRIVDLTEGG